MPRPYIVGSYASDYSSASTTKSVIISCQDGDSLLVVSQGASNANISGASAAGITFSTDGFSGSASNPAIKYNYAVRVAKQTNLSISVTELNGTVPWGFTCIIVRNAFIFSASGTGTGIGGVSGFIDSPDNVRCLMLGGITDGAGTDGSSRVWKTIEGFTPSVANGFELVYQNIPTKFTAYVASFPVSNQAGQSVSPTLATSVSNASICIMTIVGDDSPIRSMQTTNMDASSYAATTTATVNNRSTRIAAKSILLATACVGVQTASGTDSAVTTTMTANGIPMTSIAKVHANNAAQGYIEVFYLLNPPSIAQIPIVLTASSSVDLCLQGGAVFYNVDQANPFLSVGTSANFSSTVAVNTPVTTNRPVIYAAMTSQNNISATNNSAGSYVVNSSLQNFNNLSYGGCSAVQHITNPQLNQSTGWTLASSGPWAAVALVLNPTSYFPTGSVYGLGM